MEERPALRPVLGRWQLLGLGIGTIIGSGVFVIPGPAAALFAGPAIILSLVLAALGCALAGLCYAELAAMLPAAGSAYTYGFQAFGRLPGWLIGWLLILEYLFAAAIVSEACAAYALGPITSADAPLVALLKSLFPTLLMLAVSWPVVRGVELSVNLISLIVLLKVGVILLVIVFGAPYVNPHFWRPFIPRNSGHWGEYGWSGVLRAAGIVFYAYLGFDTVSVAAQESQRPQRDVPFALLGSLIVCSALFVLMMAVVTGLVSYRELNVANPVAIAIGAAGPSLNWLTGLVRITAVISMVSVLVAVLLAASRILFAMAQDGLLPSPIGRLHRHHKTPVGGTMVSVAAAALLTLIFPIGVLAQMVSIGVLSAFIAVAVVVLVWRRNRPQVARPFRAPWVPAVPLGAIVVCGYMAVGLPAATWWRFAAWSCLGLVVYFVYGARSVRPSKPGDK